MKLLTTMMLAVCMSFSLSACESNTLENEPETPVAPQHPDEENSSSTGNIIPIGTVTSDLGQVRSLGQRIDVTIALAGTYEDDNNTNEDKDMIMKITVNGRTLTATLEDNVTARAFAAKIPEFALTSNSRMCERKI